MDVCDEQTYHAGSQSEQSQSKQAGHLAVVQAELGGDLQTLSVRHDSLDQQALSAVDVSQPLREGDPEVTTHQGRRW